VVTKLQYLGEEEGMQSKAGTADPLEEKLDEFMIFADESFAYVGDWWCCGENYCSGREWHLGDFGGRNAN
jgi:hypothetical protein